MERSDRPVAFVGEVTITVRHVHDRMRAMRRDPGSTSLPLPGSPEDRRLQRWVVQALVDEAVVADAALAMGRSLLEGQAGSADIVTSVFEQVTADLTVPDSAVEAYYAGNPERFCEPERRLVQQVLVEDEATAHELHARRMAGATWSELALAAAGGADALGHASRHWVVRGELSGPLEDRLFAAGPGAFLAPVHTEFGWHVAEVVAVSPACTVSLDAAREGIRADLLAAARGRQFDGWLAQRRAALARVLPGHEHPGDPRVPDHVHRH